MANQNMRRTGRVISFLAAKAVGASGLPSALAEMLRRGQ